MPSAPLECLSKRSEFVAVTKGGKLYPTPAFILQVYQRSHQGPARYGITASKKVGGAVERNRAKRRLRALISHVLAPHALPGRDYVLIARHDILKRNFALMREELATVLIKAQQRKAESKSCS